MKWFIYLFFRDLILEAYFKIKKTMVSKKKESIIRMRVGQKNLSLKINVCHHSASLVMPNCDPWDGFFYLTLMIDSYVIFLGLVVNLIRSIQLWY